MSETSSNTKQVIQVNEQVLSRTKQLTARNTRSDLVKWLAAAKLSAYQKEVVENRFEGTYH